MVSTSLIIHHPKSHRFRHSVTRLLHDQQLYDFSPSYLMQSDLCKGNYIIYMYTWMFLQLLYLHSSHAPVNEHVEGPDDACDGDGVKGNRARQLPALQWRHLQPLPLAERFNLANIDF